MLVQQVLHAMDSEASAPGAGKQYLAAASLRLAQPSFYHSERRFGDRGAAFLSPLADYTYVSTSPEDQILACETGHLR